MSAPHTKYCTGDNEYYERLQDADLSEAGEEMLVMLATMQMLHDDLDTNLRDDTRNPPTKEVDEKLKRMDHLIDELGRIVSDLFFD